MSRSEWLIYQLQKWQRGPAVREEAAIELQQIMMRPNPDLSATDPQIRDLAKAQLSDKMLQLLENGIYPNLKESGCTAFMFAAKHCNMRVINDFVRRALIEDVNPFEKELQNTRQLFEEKVFKDMPAIFYAVQNHDPEVWQFFLGETENPNLKKAGYILGKPESINFSAYNEFTPLMCASQAGTAEAVAALIKHGAKVDEQDFNGKTALKYAAENNNLVAARVLLEHGAQVNLSMKINYSPAPVDLLSEVTPLITAVKSKNIEMVKLFLDHGAEVNLAAKHTNQTCLFFALRSPNIVELLIENGADPSLKDRYGVSPAMLAGRRGALDVLTILFKTKKGLEETKEDALLEAVRADNIDAVTFILKQGVRNIDVADKDGRTSLNLASDRNPNGTAIAKLLFSYGAHPEIADKDGMSAACRAAENGNQELTKLFIEREVKLDETPKSVIATTESRNLQNEDHDNSRSSKRS